MFRLLVLVALATLAASAPAAAQTCTTAWAAAQSGAWSTAANWTSGVPGPGDTACITVGGTYTVTLDQDQALAGLVLGGASGQQTLRLGRTLTSLGSGTVGERGRLEVLNSANCGSCDGLPRVEGILTVEGTITHTALTGLVSQGGTLDVAPGGLLLVDTGVNSVSIGGRSGDVVSTLRVRGRAVFAPGDATPRSTRIFGRFELDGGTLVLTADRLDVAADGLLRDATFEIAEGAVVNLTNANSNGAAGLFEAEGTVAGEVLGSLTLSGGDIRATSAGATLALTGRGLALGTAVLSGDRFVNTGLVRFGFNAPRIQGATLRNEGTLRIVEATLTLWEGAEIENAPGGLIDLVDQGSVGSGTGGGRIAGAGRIEARPDARTSARSAITVPTDLDGATVEAAEQTRLQLSEGALRDVTFRVAETGEVLLTSSNSNGLSGTFEAAGTLSGEGPGTLRLSGGRLRVGAADVTLAFDGAGLVIQNGVGLEAAGGATGAFLNTGLVVFQNNAPGVRAATLRNTGTLRMEGASLILSEGAEVENAAGGLIDLVNGGSVSGGTGGLLVSRGRLAATGSGRSSVTVPIDLAEATIAVTAERLQLSEGALRDVAFEVAAGSGVLLSSSNTNGLSGVFETSGTLSGEVQGAVDLSGGRLLVDAAGATLALGGAGLVIRNGVGLDGPQGAPVLNTGRIVFQNNVPGVQAVALRNEGTLRVEGPIVRLTGGTTVTNAASGTLEFAGQGSFASSDEAGGTVVNEGLVLKAGAGRAEFRGTLRGRPGSELRVLRGELFLANEDPAEFGAGVRLTAAAADSASFWTSQPLQGTLSPGVPGLPVAAVNHNGTLAFDSQAGDARLVIDVGPGGVSDRVETEQRITLGGTLVVRLADGFAPRAGDAWTILTDLRNNVPQGAFESVEVVGDAGGLAFVVDASQAGAVVLRATSGAAVSAPVAEITEGEPATFRIRHAVAAEPFTINFETDGTATPFVDYTLTASRGALRAEAGAAETVVSLYARRDADPNEGPEAVTFRIVPGGDASPADGAAEASVVIRDAPSSEALALADVVPARGETGGTVTPTILGTGLGAGAEVRLVGAVTVPARVVEAATNGGLSAEFDLADAPAGRYGVVVTQGGQTATLSNAFEVVPAQRQVRVWADVAGTPAPRFGRWSTYTVLLGNDSDADIYDVGLVLRITEGAEFEFLEGVQDLDGAPVAEQQLALEGVEGVQSVPLYFKKLPARSSGSFRVRVRPQSPLRIGDDVGVAYELYPPDPENPFTWSGDFEDAVPFNYGVLIGAFGAYVEAYPPDGNDAASGSPTARSAPAASAAASRNAASVASQNGPRCPPDDDTDQPPLIQEQSVDDIIRVYDQGNRFNRYHGSNIEPSTSTAVSEYSGFALGQVLSNASKSAGYSSAANVAGGVATMWQIRSYGKKANSILCERQREGSLPTSGDSPCTPPSPPGGGGGGGGTSGGPGTGGACGQTGGSFDPNDKLGPAGFAEARYYDPATVSTPYTIRFENIETASFPAQEVVIVDTLDARVFDLSTFSLGPIRWGERRVVTPPPGAMAFEAEVDLAPEVPARLLITAALDMRTGRAVWRFATLDPATGDLPEDGRVGFLPPNRTSPEGEGSVTFTVAAREGLMTGTAVSNGAEIVFDINAPIVTPTWTNTVDRTAPASRVEPLGATTAGPIEITVSGSDDGAGVQLYGLFASQDGGDFTLVARSETPTFSFEGEPGRQYGFFSLALDAVGNAEPFKTQAEATTLVSVDGEEGPGLPAVLSLSPPFPNPVRQTVRLRLGVPTEGTVRVCVIDALGREVARLLDSETRAGWHPVEFDASGLAAGVYVVRLTAGAEEAVRTLTVIR